MKKRDIQQRMLDHIGKFVRDEITEQDLRTWLHSERDLTKMELLGFVMAHAKRSKGAVRRISSGIRGLP